MIDELRKNIEQERRIVEEMEAIDLQLLGARERERRSYLSSLDALKSQLRVLNNAVPVILGGMSAVKKLAPWEDERPKDVVKMSYVSPSAKKKRFITISKKDKEKFAKSLHLSEKILVKKEKKQKVEMSRPSYLARISNRFFSSFSEKLTPTFDSLKEDLKKANIRFTITTYLSIALFVSSLVFIASLIVFGVLSVVNVKYLIWIWIPFVLTGLCFLLFYIYPANQKGTVNKKISDELPFATIYMAAIAGSDIEPTKIFKIIAMSPEYKNVGYEIKKMINQVDVYGYDLVTALKNSAKATSNKKLAELFSGMATNIVSGGSLKSYLEKKAENYLMDYRLDRQRYSRLAETFMDVYISILVAAPMVLMMLVVVMNLTGMGGGVSLGLIMVFAIAGVALVNIVFLIILQIKQPKT